MRATVLFAVLAMLAVATTAHGAERPESGWVIGLGAGGGSAMSSTWSEGDEGAAGAFRVGRLRGRHLILGVEAAGWTRTEEGASASFTTTTIAATWFPTSSSWFVRPGLGGATSDGNAVRSTTGFGAAFATGFDFRLSPGLSLAPEVDLGVGAFEGFSTFYSNVTLNLNWTFGR